LLEYYYDYFTFYSARLRTSGFNLVFLGFYEANDTHL
jgi:hypothetical protein